MILYPTVNTEIPEHNFNVYFYLIKDQKVKLMAERVGFEPTIPLTVYKLSNPAPRTLRCAANTYLITKLQ